MALNREGMKSLLIRDKGFLRELYEGPKDKLKFLNKLCNLYSALLSTLFIE